MSAAVNDRPHEIVPAVHLPLTGELHPLRREFARWLATGNLITITLAVVVCATIYFWPRQAPITIPGIDQLVDRGRIFPSPPPIVEHGGGGSPGDYSVISNVANIEPVKNDELAPETNLEKPPGTGEGEDPLLGPITTVNGSGPPIDIDPTPPTPNDDFIAFDTAPVFISITPPVYPEMVKDAGIEGTVMVRVFIGLNGHVKDAYVVEGSPALRDAALASARTAFFKAALQGNHPVEVWVVIPITFQLHQGY